MAVGFACQWYTPDPEPTWSFTPWNLREQLRLRTEVVDVGPSFSRVRRAALKTAFTRRVDGGWRSEWTRSALYDSLAERQVRAEVGRHDLEAVLHMSDFGTTSVPDFLYQDLSHDLLLRRFDDGVALPQQFNDLTLRSLRAGAERQREIYDGAAGLLCMSEWLAADVIRSGQPRSKVHVVNPGVSAVSPTVRPLGRERTGRLLLVGVDLLRKGLAPLLAALPQVRARFPGASLTVVGPDEWPAEVERPEGVDFLGHLSPSEVGALLPEHDLFVMPSEWEAFGIVFVEALLAGLPCIGRADCAMPEIIRAPERGRLVGEPGRLDVDPDELAAAVVEALLDDDLYGRVAAQHDDLVAHYSWSRAADEALSAIAAV